MSRVQTQAAQIPSNATLEQNDSANDQQQQTVAVKQAAASLKGGFGTGAEHKNDALIRRVSQMIAAEEFGNVDLSKPDASIDGVFTNVMDGLGERADEIGAEIGKQIADRLRSLSVCATRAVTLNRGIVAIDMAKAYVNWRPSSKLVNQTFFTAV